MKYGFIGCGNMGGALARALAKTTADFYITDRSGRGKALAQELGCVYTDVMTIAEECDRSYLMEEVLAPLQAKLQQNRPTLITMAAGLSMERIADFAGGPLPIIRIMPNTPTAVGKGITLYCANELADPAVVDSFLADMTHSGRLDKIPESLMDAGSALSGSGPAYVYLFIEALADGAVSCGIPRAQAMELAAGAAEMVLASGKHPGELKDAVCSPKGSTIAGIRALEARGFRSAVTEGLIATYERNLEMGK